MPSDVVDVMSNISLYVAGICHLTTCMTVAAIDNHNIVASVVLISV